MQPGISNAVWGMQFIWPIKAEYVVVYLSDDYSQTSSDAVRGITRGSWPVRRRSPRRITLDSLIVSALSATMSVATPRSAKRTVKIACP